MSPFSARQLDPGLPGLGLLGLDAGGSGTKWSLLQDSAVIASGRTAPITSALLETPAGQAALAELVSVLPLQPSALHAGLPGLSAGSVRASAVAGLLAEAFGLTAKRVSVEGDLDLAYRAHLQPGEGVLVYAGTGSIAYHVAQSAQAYRAGGRGYRIGDDGGGSSIGRAALRWATAFLDAGEVPQGCLADEMASITGGLDWDTLRAFVYTVPGASALASLAPAVTRAAQQGDQVALTLLDEAARSLAHIARCVQGQVGALPVIATGGALRSEPLQQALRQALPGVRIQFKDHAETAARLASSLL